MNHTAHLTPAGRRKVAGRVVRTVVPLVPVPEAPLAGRLRAIPRREERAVLVQVLAVRVVQDVCRRGARLRRSTRCEEIIEDRHGPQPSTAEPRLIVLILTPPIMSPSAQQQDDEAEQSNLNPGVRPHTTRAGKWTIWMQAALRRAIMLQLGPSRWSEVTASRHGARRRLASGENNKGVVPYAFMAAGASARGISPALRSELLEPEAGSHHVKVHVVWRVQHHPRLHLVVQGSVLQLRRRHTPRVHLHMHARCRREVGSAECRCVTQGSACHEPQRRMSSYCRGSRRGLYQHHR